MKLRVISVWLLFGLLACAATAQTAPATPQNSPAGSPDYVIGESDILSINVWHEAELSRDVPVRSDGKISLPLVGDLDAAGKTAEQLKEIIAEKLKTYLENPEVTVIVKEARSQYFTVIGQVMKPGQFPLGQRLTVLDGLAMAGGFKDFVKPGKIYVLRQHRNGSSERLPFDYKRAMRGDLQQNFQLEARDTIVVP